MANYHVKLPNGAEYNIEADSDDQVSQAVDSLVASTKNPADDYKKPENNGFELLSDTGGDDTRAGRPNGKMANYWESRGDYQEPGVEKPVEQKLADNTIEAGNGAMLPAGIAAVGGLAKSGVAAVGKALNGMSLTKNLVPTVGDLANEQFVKSLGASARQIRKIGPDAAREAADVGRAAGMDDVFSTMRGRKQALDAMDAETGAKIGDLRAEAGKPAPMEESLGSEIKRSVGDRYDSGVGSSQKGNYQKAMEDVQKLGPDPTYSEIAEKATEMNKAAAKKGIALPDTAATKVAGTMSGINDQGIVRSLGSDKGLEYVNSLHDLSGIKTIEQMRQFGEAREVASRQGLVKSLFHTAMETGGYRATSKGLNALHETLNGPVNFSSSGAAIATNTIGGLTSRIMNALTTNPQSLGKYAAPLSQAAQSGGQQGIAATHFVLSHQYPDYNAMFMGDKSNESGQ